MITEYKHGESHLGRRTAAATVVGTLGSLLLVATVVRLLQVGQEILPWWWPYPVIIGGMLFIAALLLLVPPEWWGAIGKLRRLPLWFKQIYRWRRYGPRSSIDKLTVRSEILENPPGVRYTANVGLLVRNRDIYSIKVDFDSLMICLEQEEDWETLRVRLENQTGIGTIVIPRKKSRDFQVVAKAECIGNAERWPNPQNHYDWCIQGVYVTFRGNRRELREERCDKTTNERLLA